MVYIRITNILIIKVGVIYYDRSAIPSPETDYFNGGGLIYFRVSELKSRFYLKERDRQGVTPKPKPYTPKAVFIHAIYLVYLKVILTPLQHSLAA